MIELHVEKNTEFSCEIDEPTLYKVVLLNDDYTTMEFVVMILKQIFHMSEEKAVLVMNDIHQKGSGVCGVYTYEIAQTKVYEVHENAKNNGFPLRAIVEEE